MVHCSPSVGTADDKMYRSTYLMENYVNVCKRGQLLVCVCTNFLMFNLFPSTNVPDLHLVTLSMTTSYPLMPLIILYLPKITRPMWIFIDLIIKRSHVSPGVMILYPLVHNFSSLSFSKGVDPNVMMTRSSSAQSN